MRIRLRLCDEDRERYGGPEWLVFDEDRLNHLPVETLEEWEALLPHPLSITAALTEWNFRMTVRSIRVVLWLALRMAGVEHPYPDFTPAVLETRLLNADLNPDVVADMVAGGDADPPASGGPPAEEQPPEPPSSSPPPTPGPAPAADPPGLTEPSAAT